MSINPNPNQDQALDKLNDTELNQTESSNVKSDGAELNQNNESIKNEGFNWGKLSFILGLISLVMTFIYFTQKFNEWFLISFFGAPIIATINVIFCLVKIKKPIFRRHQYFFFWLFKL